MDQLQLDVFDHLRQDSALVAEIERMLEIGTAVFIALMVSSLGILPILDQMMQDKNEQ